VKPWFVYTGIRVAIFVVAFIVLLIVGMPAWLAAIVAAVIGLCAAYIFFRPQRDALAALVQERREGRGASTIDEDAEDS
jgi:uncharacterized membrane protein YphA (DoxX/SURF4 family)